MSTKSVAIDITSLNGIDSLFRGGARDPWAHRLAGRLADLVVYFDAPRVIAPIPASEVPPLSQPSLPRVLRRLMSLDRSLFGDIPYDVHEARRIRPEYLPDALAGFTTWALNSRHAFRRWLEVHDEPWIRNANVGPRYVFDIADLHNDPAVDALSKEIGVSANDILYGLDVVLRYPLYGELVGPDAYLLAHPIRELQQLPTMVTKVGPAIPVALSLGEVVAAMAPSMTLDQYTAFLHEARGTIRDRRIHEIKPGALDLETTREIASVLGLPARIGSAGKVLAVAVGMIGVAGASPVLGPPAAIAGGIVSVASALWSGTVPRGLSHWRWLRWALRWDVERQASDARNS